MAKPVRVKITYCAECGYEPMTLELTERLMKEFQQELSAIEIIPWFQGSFDVRVGEDLVHSMYRDGGFPEYETVARVVRNQLTEE